MVNKKSMLEQLFYAVSIITVVFGGIIWVCNINWVSAANTSEIKELRVKQDQDDKKFEEIRVKLTHIEDLLK